MVRLINIVDDSLLPDVMNTGIIDDDVQKTHVSVCKSRGRNWRRCCAVAYVRRLDPALIRPGKRLQIPVIKD